MLSKLRRKRLLEGHSMKEETLKSPNAGRNQFFLQWKINGIYLFYTITEKFSSKARLPSVLNTCKHASFQLYFTTKFTTITKTLTAKPMNEQNDSKLKQQRKTYLYFIMKVIELNKLQAKCSTHAIHGFLAESENFSTTKLSSCFR